MPLQTYSSIYTTPCTGGPTLQRWLTGNITQVHGAVCNRVLLLSRASSVSHAAEPVCCESRSQQPQSGHPGKLLPYCRVRKKTLPRAAHISTSIRTDKLFRVTNAQIACSLTAALPSLPEALQHADLLLNHKPPAERQGEKQFLRADAEDTACPLDALWQFHRELSTWFCCTGLSYTCSGVSGVKTSPAQC